jgi:hypothetical protein
VACRTAAEELHPQAAGEGDRPVVWRGHVGGKLGAGEETWDRRRGGEVTHTLGPW